MNCALICDDENQTIAVMKKLFLLVTFSCFTCLLLARLGSLSGEVPSTRILQNKTAGPGEFHCLDATQDIQAAGAGTYFRAESGSEVNLVAGEEILLFPGTHLQSGSRVHARIAPEGPFCGEPDKLMVSIDAEAEIMTNQTVATNEHDGALLQGERLFRVYPNPTPGRFTLELFEKPGSEKCRVEVFGLRGERILSEELPGDLTHHQISLEGQLPGMYFIRVITGQNAHTMSLLKK
jgi:hypothetical protein